MAEHGTDGSGSTVDGATPKAADPSTLRVTATSGILTLELARPERRNALNPRLRQELCDAVAAAATDETTRVVVLTGAGGHFCAGADLLDLDVDGLADEMAALGGLILALRALPQPVIAKVSGHAAGAGANLALACDLVIADESARFTQIFARVGLSPDLGGSWTLPRLVGTQRARELALLGDEVDGPTAARLGLVMRCVPTDELDATVGELAGRLAGLSPHSQARTKHLLDDAWTTTLAEALEREAAAQVANAATPEFHEALSRFRTRHQGDRA